MGNKACIHCCEIKSLSLFVKDIKCKDGHRNVCKACWNLANKKLRDANKDRYNALQRKNYRKNAKKVIERTTKYRKENPEIARKASRKHYWKDAEKSRAKGRAYRRKNHAKILERERLHRKHNAEYYRKKSLEAYYKNPEKNNARNKAYREREKVRIAKYNKERYYKDIEASRKYCRDFKVRNPDGYARNIICANTGLKSKDIPQELVDLKRVQLLIYRETIK